MLLVWLGGLGLFCCGVDLCFYGLGLYSGGLLCLGVLFVCLYCMLLWPLLVLHLFACEVLIFGFGLVDGFKVGCFLFELCFVVGWMVVFCLRVVLGLGFDCFFFVCCRFVLSVLDFVYYNCCVVLGWGLVILF